MNNSPLYPLKFNSIFLEKIWGGEKIKNILCKDYGNLKNCGESWELSGVENSISIVKEGELKGKSLTELISLYGKDLVGKRNSEEKDFPLLIKYIDANQDLSVQVHPNEEIAQKRHQTHGKTEMWYAINADENTKLISGFNKDTNKQEFLEKLEDGTISEILNEEEVHKGDVFFLPAGRIHTIGKGSLILEIQQSSDITYRIYDFDRIGLDGNKRELHIEESIDVIDYHKEEKYKTDYTNSLVNERILLAKCDYFYTNKINLNTKLDLSSPSKDSFTVYIGIEGDSTLTYNNTSYSILANELILIPANITSYSILPNSENSTIMEVYVP